MRYGISRTIVVPVAYVHLDDTQLSGRAQYAIQMMMSKGVHARDEDSNAGSDRSANWQVAVRLRGRRNAILRVVNTAVVVEIVPPVLLLLAHVTMVTFR